MSVSNTVSLESPKVQQHLERTVRVWLGLHASERVVVPSLPAELARLFLRIEEVEQSHRDQWGCWEHAFSDNYRRGQLWEPEVDAWVAARRTELQRSTPLEPLWPSGHRFAICLTHDVDMVTRASTPAHLWRQVVTGLAPSGDLSRRARAMRWLGPIEALGRASVWGVRSTPSTRDSLERCVALESEFGVRGSYFFAVYPPLRRSRYDCVYTLTDRCEFRGRTRRVADVIVSLAEEGFDIGLHGSYYSATSDGVLAAEKHRLEAATGLSLTSTRQHYLHWDATITPRLQAAAGFTADTTLGYNRNVGFRAGTSLPHFLFDLGTGSALDLLEVPLIVQEGPLLKPNALGLPPMLARSLIARLLDAVAAVQGAATLLFHPHSLVSEDVYELYRWCLEQAVDRGAWLTSLKGIDAWWRARAARLGAG
jgi:hypothetical protein